MRVSIAALLFGAIFGVLIGGCTSAQSKNYEFESLYKNLPFKMGHIERPTFPANEVSIVDFGGIGNGVTLNTNAFSRAIAALSAKGGGVLNVPQGVWLTGPVTLKSNINLHITDRAIIVFTPDFDQYEIVSTIFEGLDTRRCQSPINARGAKNIAITGDGTIDGSGGAWRPVKQNKTTCGQWKALVASGGVLNSGKDIWFPSQKSLDGSNLSDMNVPRNFTTDHQWNSVKDFLRPVMISLIECENVLLEGVTFQNSPSWNIHPLMCKNLIINGVNVRNPWYAQNGDGIDIESCENVIVCNSTFDVGDDALCLKSGKDADGRRRGRPTTNVLVDNCVVFHGHGGFVVGSEMSGGVSCINVTNCQFLGTDVGLRFKSTRGRGGVVENIYISNISMIDIATEPILFDLYYSGKSASESLDDGDQVVSDHVIPTVSEQTPTFRNIFINNVNCRGARRAMFFNGLPEMNITNVNVSNSSIYSVLGAEFAQSDGVVLRNVHVVASQGAALTLRNVKNMVVDDFTTAIDDGAQSVDLSGNNRNIVFNSKKLF